MSADLHPTFLSEYGSKTGQTIFDKSKTGTVGVTLPDWDVPAAELPPAELLDDELVGLPEVDEPTILRHNVGLSNLNYSIESGMYPLGSCTMKYNPRIHEEALRYFLDLHPEQPVETIQGTLQMLYELQGYMASILGLRAATLTPMAGAHGELAGILMIKAYHVSRGEGGRRRKVLVPDSAHGTNPATAAMAGYQVVPVKSRKEDGNMDRDDFRSKLGPDVAGAMITQPSTLGLFDTGIEEVAELLHKNGSLLYGDGANMNALLAKVTLGSLGFDVVHINTHKALTTPHGGGGPGAGPVAVSEALMPFLPTPTIIEENGRYDFKRPEQTIGRLGTWYGNVGVLLRAYSYIRTMGEEGLRAVSENAVLNANYLKFLLAPDFDIQYGAQREAIMHEVVISGTRQKKEGQVTTLSIAKRLIDYGYHPPTIYFPLITEEGMMVEPTETENRESLDRFGAAMRAIAREVRENPEVFATAPHNTPVGRLDEAKAARKPILRWRPSQSE